MSGQGGIRLEEISEEMAPAVEEFNQRMAAAGSDQRLSTLPSFSRIQRTADSPIEIKSYAAWVGDAIRGGVNIKVLPFWIRDEMVPVAFYNRPLSEGIVDPAWSMVGTMIQKLVVKQHPLVYGLGVGSATEPVARLMMATGWSCDEVPFLFKVLRAGPFLREVQALKTSKSRAVASTVASSTGMGSLGLGVWQTWQRLRGHSAASKADLSVEIEPTWGRWADTVWQQSREHYALVGDRSAATLAALFPTSEERYRRVRVRRGSQEVGWAIIMIAQLDGHNHFGNLRLGSLIDAFAAPADAGPVVSAAVREIERIGCDLIVSNLSHPAWAESAIAAGMVRGPSNYLLFLSKALQQRLGNGRTDHFFSRGDGDGPANLS